jgi:hypothetical protein
MRAQPFVFSFDKSAISAREPEFLDELHPEARQATLEAAHVRLRPIQHPDDLFRAISMHYFVSSGRGKDCCWRAFMHAAMASASARVSLFMTTSNDSNPPTL